jgi:hypothetical protein
MERRPVLIASGAFDPSQTLADKFAVMHNRRRPQM